jgi:hypothetical protein
VTASQIVKYAAISALILGVLLVLALLLFLGGNQWN